MASSSNELPPLRISDVYALLSRSDQARNAILVGGQAANFWAVRYGLRAEGVMVSADVDFIGTPQAAMQAGLEWEGRVDLPGFGDFTPNTAVVYMDFAGGSRAIDFLDSVLGVNKEELNRMAVTVTFSERDDFQIRVMHPFHCMVSQLTNAYGKSLNRRADPKSGDWVAERAFISVQTLNHNLQEYLDKGSVNTATRIVRKIMVFSTKAPALSAFQRDGIDVLEAIPENHPGWKAGFMQTVYEPLHKKVVRKRNTKKADKS